eukprot:ANDGO_05131.mRNA.1 hypothetical protein CAOG_08840
MFTKFKDASKKLAKLPFGGSDKSQNHDASSLSTSSSASASAATLARTSSSRELKDPSAKDPRLQNLDQGFFEHPSEFDAVEHILNSLPRSGPIDDAFFENEEKVLQDALSAITHRLAHKVHKNYTAFVSGMTMIHEIGRDVQQTAVLSSSGRHFLRELDNHLVVQSKTIVSRFGRARQLRVVMDATQALRQVLEMEQSVWDAVDQYQYALALTRLADLQEWSLVSKNDPLHREFTISQFASLRQVHAKSKSGPALIEKKMEDVLRAMTLRDFDGTKFSAILQGMFLAGKPEKVGAVVSSAVVDHAERTVREMVLSYALGSEKIQQLVGDQHQELRSMPLAQLSSYVDESNTHACMLTIFSNLIDLINNFSCFIDWALQERENPIVLVPYHSSREVVSKQHADHDFEDDEAERRLEQDLPLLASLPWFSELVDALLYNRRTLGEVMLRDVAILVTSLGSSTRSLAVVKLERFLESYQYVRVFGYLVTSVFGAVLKSDQEYVSQAASPAFRHLMKVLGEHSRGVLDAQFRPQMENLKMMMENETWMRIALHSESVQGKNMSFGELREFRQTRSWSRLENIVPSTMSAGKFAVEKLSKRYSSSASTSPVKSAFAPAALASQQNLHEDIAGVSYVPNPFRSRMDELLEEKRKASQKAGKGGKDVQGPLAADQDESADAESPWVAELEELFKDKGCIVSSSSMHILRCYGKWLHTMNVLDRVDRDDVLTRMVSMFQYFFYSVIVHFGRPPAAFQSHGNDSSQPSSSQSASQSSSSGSSLFSREESQLEKEATNPPFLCSTGSAAANQGVVNGQYVPEQDLSLRPSVSSYFSQLKSSLLSLATSSPQGSQLGVMTVNSAFSLAVGVTIPEESSNADVDRAGNMFGARERSVAMESVILVFQVLQKLRGFLEEKTRAKSGDTSNSFINSFYVASWDAVRDARITLYYRLSLRTLPYAQFSQWILQAKFDFREMMADYSEYVPAIRKEILQAKDMMEALQINDLGHSIVRILWECMLRRLMESILRGFAAVKKCSAQGRAQMAVDLKTLQAAIEKIAGFRPLPMVSVVDQYIKAFYLSTEDEWLSFYRRVVDTYTCLQVQRICEIASAASSNATIKGKAKKDLFALFENIEREYWIKEGRQPNVSAGEDVCNRAFDKGLYDTLRDML